MDNDPSRNNSMVNIFLLILGRILLNEKFFDSKNATIGSSVDNTIFDYDDNLSPNNKSVPQPIQV